MKTHISIILLTLLLICFTMSIAVEGYNICDAEEAYLKQIYTNNKNRDFQDAYMLDVYNNKQPVLCIITGFYNGYDSVDYKYNNGNITRISDKFVIHKYFTSDYNDYNWSEGLIASRGSSGGMRESFPATDVDNRVYIVENSSIRFMTDVTRMFYIGYFENGSFHKVYSRVIHFRSGNVTSYTSTAYSNDGSSYFVDLPDPDDITAVLDYFGLKRMIDNYPQNQGKEYESLTCTPSNWAVTSVNEAIQYGIIPENLQHLYKSKITRYEFCQLICSLIERSQGKSLYKIIEERCGYTFRDIENGDHKPISMKDMFLEHSPISLCEKAGIINGYGDGNLAPDDYLTRQQAATILQRTLEYLGMDEANTSVGAFNDSYNFADWAKESIQLISGCADLSGARIMGGDDNGNFMPEKNLTIEQAIVISKRTLDFLKVPIVRWIQEGFTQNEYMNTDRFASLYLKNEDIYLRCKIFDNFIAANDFEYDDATNNLMRYLNEPDKMVSDLFYYLLSGESQHTLRDKPQLLKEQLALIISNVTGENSAQNASEIKIHKHIVAKILKFGAKPVIEELPNSTVYKKAFEIAGDLEKLLDWYNFSVEQIEYITNDYTESMLYLDTIKDALILTDCDSELLIAALDELREDYHGWWFDNFCVELIKFAEDEIFSNAFNAILKKSLGSYSIFVYAVPLVMEISGLKDIHESSQNVSLSLVYSNMLIEAYKIYAKKIADNSFDAADVSNCERLFELCKAAKINEYENLLSATRSVGTLSGNSLGVDNMQKITLSKIIKRPVISLSGASMSNPVYFLEQELKELKKLSYNKSK